MSTATAEDGGMEGSIWGLEPESASLGATNIEPFLWNVISGALSLAVTDASIWNGSLGSQFHSLPN
jgi:hypothetical protein